MMTQSEVREGHEELLVRNHVNRWPTMTMSILHHAEVSHISGGWCGAVILHWTRCGVCPGYSLNTRGVNETSR